MNGSRPGKARHTTGNVMDSETVTDSKSGYDWANYLASMEGVPDDLPTARPTVSSAEKKPIRWGLLLCLVLTVSAMWLNELPFWPFTRSDGRHPFEPVMLAILF